MSRADSAASNAAKVDAPAPTSGAPIFAMTAPARPDSQTTVYAAPRTYAIADLTINPLPDSVLIPSSAFTGKLIGFITPDPTLVQSPVFFGASGDLTGDGNPEIVISGWGGNGGFNTTHAVPVPVYVVSTSSSGASFLDPMKLLGISSISGTSTPRILDLNKDGLNDFLYLAHNENPFEPDYSKAFIQQPNGTFIPKILAGPKAISHNSGIGDFNHDGYPDIIAAGGRMENTYFNIGWASPDGTTPALILYINNKDGTFTPNIMHATQPDSAGQTWPVYSPGSAAAMADFNNDGQTSIVLSDTHVDLSPQSDPSSRNDNWIIHNVQLGKNEAWGSISKLPNPYLEDKPEFASLPSFLGTEKSHDIKVLTMDVDHDGLTDIMISSIIWDGTTSHNEAGVLQVLRNRGNFQFEDVTDSTLYNYYLGKSSGHHIQVMDVNGDGFPDIVVPESGNGNYAVGWGLNGTDAQTWANHVLINAGNGKFVQAMWNEFHELTLSEKNIVSQDIFPGFYDSVYFPYMTADDRLGFIKMEGTYEASGSRWAFFDFRAKVPLSTGPAGIDPALKGAPGFSEYFYLTQYPDAAAAVAAGTYTSGLDHYLKVGKALGNFAFAPNVTIRCNAGSTSAIGREGNETFIASAPNYTIDGGAGTDTVVFGASRGGFTVVNTGSSFTLTDNSGALGTYTLKNIERLQFTDGIVALDTSGTGGEAYRLYQAAFARTPDAAGLGYHIWDLEHGLTLSQVAAQFIASPEFQSLYGTVNDTQFITLLYQNVLHRAPDPDGLQYHLGEIASGQSRADILTHFSESPENQANVMAQIQNGFLFVPSPH